MNDELINHNFKVLFSYLRIIIYFIIGMFILKAFHLFIVLDLIKRGL